MSNGATFSDCTRYRYKLWRRWGDGNALAFCMLNPSTADAVANDPTVERCERRARAWGYSALLVVNLFAFRSTNPNALRAACNPIGPNNRRAIEWALDESTMFVCGWGAHPFAREWGRHNLWWLKTKHPGRAHALRMLSNGQPAHPLYLPYALTPQPIV